MADSYAMIFKRLRLPVILLAGLCLLSLTSAVHADDDDEDDYQLQYVSPDKFLEIWSDHKIAQDRCEQIATRAMKAYKFDAQQESWSDQDLLYKPPLKFRVVGDIKSKILGYAQGANLFVVRDSYLDDELSEGTLAHELTHIQDKRQVKKGKIPSFMLEGRALTNGHSYRVSIGQSDNQYDRGMAKSAVGYTAKDAQEILSETEGMGWNNQAMGTFLVEYMRTKWNGTGVPDIHPRLSKMIVKMAAGADFESAFAAEFGTPFSALLKSFMKYLDDTQEKPLTRLQGTMWQGIAQSAPAEEDDDD